MRPLEGVRVVDFTTLLPGPLATLMMAEAGAEVIKIERPTGDELRWYEPRIGADSLVFAQLNRGKRSIAIDLKQPGGRDALMPLLRKADVLVEQFRPGTMERLGLGYETLREENSRLIYCSITGYGGTGTKADKAAHDLNYVAEAGLLSVAGRPGEPPQVPPTLIADIGGGAYPAMINTLLGLQQRERTGRGCRIEVAMHENVLPFLYWAVGEGLGLDCWPSPGSHDITGGSPRYGVYRTADAGYLAVAPLEQRFWKRFCEILGLPRTVMAEDADRGAVRTAVGEAIAANTVEHWRHAFEGEDACVSVVPTLREALEDPHLRARGVFDHKVTAGGRELPMAPVPIDVSFRGGERSRAYPALGEANGMLAGEIEKTSK